jgi:hypothetical protein
LEEIEKTGDRRWTTEEKAMDSLLLKEKVSANGGRMRWLFGV